VIDLDAFEDGMLKLGRAFSREISEGLLDTFAEVLSPRLNTQQWLKAVDRCLESESYFPPPAVLLRYGADDRVLAAAAGDAYERIVACYERGDNIGYREVQERFGHAAAEGFVAAGGSRRFAWCEPDDEPFRLKDFRAAYVEQAEVDPISALPAGEAEAKRLPPTKAEAARVLKSIGVRS
jgi:hypothetical protein